MAKEVLISWNELAKACKAISSKIGKIDVLVAIAKGGLVPARLLAKNLNIREIYSIGVKSYDNKKSGKIEFYQKLNTKLNGKIVLIVDDISDSGKTFHAIEPMIKKLKPKKIMTCSVYVKKGTAFVPDYYYKIVPKDEWIVFPWEK